MGQTLNQTWAAHFVGALVASGLRRAVVCPGSRSTPLVLALADHPEVAVTPVLDERAAAFVALGMARASSAPVAVVCTSGTAGAHFLPAAIEASHSGLPLVLITADRPWELQAFGAPQTVDQRGLFGAHVRDAQGFDAPDAALVPHLVAVTLKSLALATAASPGPVHFNVPMREPLAPPQDAPGPVVAVSTGLRVPALLEPRLDGLRGAIASARKGLILCGPRWVQDGFGEAVSALGRQLGFAVLADAASGARYGHGDVVTTADALLRVPAFAQAMRPDVVLRFGLGVSSRALQAFVDDSGARLFCFPEGGVPVDPQHRAEAIVEGRALSVCRLLTGISSGSAAYRQRFLAADALARAALEKETAFSEAAVARAVVGALPPHASLVVSSSMPIRDVDSFAHTAAGKLSVHANRGANGIDGVVSTAVGVALASAGPTAVLLGDLAALHDLSGLMAAGRHGASLAVVVVNNDGGGIFEFLPVAQQRRHFEALFATPQGVDFSHVAALCGATLHRPETCEALQEALGAALEGGLHLVEVRTDRKQNVELHRRAFAAVREAVEQETPWR